jgi:hypothetical protein
MYLDSKKNTKKTVAETPVPQLKSAGTPRYLEDKRSVNATGLPNRLKAGIEHLSGHSLDDVKVHYSSAKPAQLQAHAYAQGTQIHIAAGQEKHLPHEAWHVVQQKQGRVKATMQMKGKVNVNDDVGLEKEADLMGEKALNSIRIKTDSINLQKKAIMSTPAQFIRIKLDHANDQIMNNVREAKVPKPGTKNVDGFIHYDNRHPPIGNHENIILEGHGTHLKTKSNEDYDSQAELTPQQLANIAFMIPKPDDWAGQIILFGCATGPLTMEVSRHYLSLSGKKVNVVGTLADIKMELKKKEKKLDGKQPSYHQWAEYEKQGGKFPKAPDESASARYKFLEWTGNIKQGATEALIALFQFKNSSGSALNGRERDLVVGKLSDMLIRFKFALATKPNYEGMTHRKDDNSEREIEVLIQMLLTAISEIYVYELRLADPNSELVFLDDEATKFEMFFDHLNHEVLVLEALARRSAKAVPEGVVDWEGENVLNSRADNADGVSKTPLAKEKLISDKWGKRGGGSMLAQTLTYRHSDDDNDS